MSLAQRKIAMTPKKNKPGGIVYSTEFGRTCPACGRPVAGCACRRAGPSPKNDGIVRVGRVTKGCKGKGLTVITGIPLDDDSLAALAKQLKQKCGAGGTIKDGGIEIQGDHRDMLEEELKARGYKVKRAGG
jgi:translation initiation factor 1